MMRITTAEKQDDFSSFLLVIHPSIKSPQTDGSK